MIWVWGGILIIEHNKSLINYLIPLSDGEIWIITPQQIV